MIGTTGCGKTNLMMRLWVGWYAAATGAFRAGEPHRPPLVAVD